MEHGQKIWYSYNGKVIPALFTRHEGLKRVAFTRQDTSQAWTADAHRVFEDEKAAREDARREIRNELEALKQQLNLRVAALQLLDDPITASVCRMGKTDHFVLTVESERGILVITESTVYREPDPSGLQFLAPVDVPQSLVRRVECYLDAQQEFWDKDKETIQRLLRG